MAINTLENLKVFDLVAAIADSKDYNNFMLAFFFFVKMAKCMVWAWYSLKMVTDTRALLEITKCKEKVLIKNHLF